MEHVFFSHILGMSSSQLTFIFFQTGRVQPPTSFGRASHSVSSILGSIQQQHADIRGRVSRCLGVTWPIPTYILQFVIVSSHSILWCHPTKVRNSDLAGWFLPQAANQTWRAAGNPANAMVLARKIIELNAGNFRPWLITRRWSVPWKCSTKSARRYWPTEIKRKKQVPKKDVVFGVPPSRNFRNPPTDGRLPFEYQIMTNYWRNDTSLVDHGLLRVDIQAIVHSKNIQQSTQSKAADVHFLQKSQ